jgi:multimeric flavodoxin WrbA
MKLLCISASNIIQKENGTSYKICQLVIDHMNKKLAIIKQNIIELKKYILEPCIGCGKCFYDNRCKLNDDFNIIYEEIIDTDIVVFVSPHYAPIPAKLAMLLEKMEQITFLKWIKNNSYKSEVYGKKAGIISHGGGELWALNSYKKMVNDTIANALSTIQINVVPLNKKWNTGISLPIKKSIIYEKSIFPYQEYDWKYISQRISCYINCICNGIANKDA